MSGWRRRSSGQMFQCCEKFSTSSSKFFPLSQLRPSSSTNWVRIGRKGMAIPIHVVLSSPQQLVRAQPSRMAALLSPLLSTPVNAARVINNPSSSLSSVSNSSCVESSSFLCGETGSFFRSAASSRSSLAVTSSVRRGSFSSASASFSCSVSVSGSSSSPACSGGTGLLAFSSPAPAPGLGRRASMTTNASSATAPSTAKSVHDFTVKDINGQEVDLSVYKGKVLLIVNVASACGLTSSNYTELAEVYAGLKESGLEILAFPCNQFGGQEPGSNEQIKAFCSRFKAEYPIFDKVDVNGPNTAPVYQFLKASKGGGILGDSIKWNFAKFLVNQDGIVVERYAPTTSPKKIEGDIKKLLAV